MFVRFRQTPTRLQASIVTTRRVAGTVRAEHLASLGSIALPMTVLGRIKFWSGVHERLARLGNRLEARTPAKLLGEIHAHVAMVTPDEQRALQLKNAQADEQFWSIISNAENASAARQRIEALQKGEIVPDGLEEPFDVERRLRAQGFTRSDLRHLIVVSKMDEATSEKYTQMVMADRRRREKVLARRLMKPGL